MNEDVSTSPFNFLEFYSPAFPFNISLGHTHSQLHNGVFTRSLLQILTGQSGFQWEEHYCSLLTPASTAPATQRTGDALAMVSYQTLIAPKIPLH